MAMLLGFGIYRARQRKKAAQVDSSFLESRLQPDSFFGASGGQRIDTAEGGQTGSSMVYSPSQLDAAGDVDPVAEADVYLAYGRDLQAEEILKEALRTNPQRVAIHSKLLEIYAKRRDAKAFEQVAIQAHALTQGSGPDWEHICQLGQELDPVNPLYGPGGQPGHTAAAVGMSAPPTMPIQAMDPFISTATQVVPANTAASAMDLDLDLDFSLGDATETSPAPEVHSTTPLRVEQTVAFQNATEPAPLDMDFGSDKTVALTVEPEPPGLPAIDLEPVKLSAPDLTLSGNELSFSVDPIDLSPPVQTAAGPVAAPAAPLESGMIEFDLGSISLDLGGPPSAPAPGPASSIPSLAEATDTAGSPLSSEFDDLSSDPLATKLALAEEFSAIGDPDGARSLAEEVVAEATGALKAKAQRFLAELT